LRWYYGWNVIAVALVFQGVTFGIGLYSATFFIQPWMNEFDAGRGDLLFAVTVATLAIGVGGPFAGKAMDRLPIRYLVAVGGALFSLGFVAVSMATAVWQIITIYALLVGGGLVMAGSIAAQTLAAKWFRGRRGFAVGIVTIGTSLGGFVMPPLTTYLIGAYEWRTACLVLAAVAAVAIIPLAFAVLGNSPEEKVIEPDPESDHSLASARQFIGVNWTTATVLRDRAYWITIVAFLPASIVFSAIQQNLAPLTFDFGIDAQKASGLMSVLAAMSVVGKIGFGSLSDRIDNRYLFWVEAGLIVTAAALLLTQPEYTGLVVICGTLGLAGGGSLPLLGSIVGTRFGPHSFGQVMGLLMPFLTISSFGAVVAGWMRDDYGNYDMALMAGFAIMVPAILGMAFMPKLRG